MILKWYLSYLIFGRQLKPPNFSFNIYKNVVLSNHFSKSECFNLIFSLDRPKSGRIAKPIGRFLTSLASPGSLSLLRTAKLDIQV
jgi:hypothetical protein